MKQLYLCILCCMALLHFTMNLSAQCDDFISLNTQTDVDNFENDYGCTVITGFLSIDFFDFQDPITNLNGLSNITSIEGSLRLFILEDNVPDLSNFDGLTSIGGSLEISLSTQAPLNLSAFDGLTSIGGSLIFSLFSLSQENITLSGFNSLNSISGSLNIFNDGSLNEISGFSSLTSIGGDVEINSTALNNLDAFSSLTQIGGSLDITANEALENINGLSNLLGISGNVQIRFNPNLSNCCTPICWENITMGGITIEENPNCVDPLDVCGCAGFTVTTNPLGDVICNGNINTQNQDIIDAFPIDYACTVFNGSLDINGFATDGFDGTPIFNIENLDGLSSIERVTGNVSLFGPMDINGLSNIEQIEGDLIISQIGENVFDNPFNLTSVGGDLVLSFLSVPNLEFLSNLTSIGGNLRIIFNSIESLEGLSSLESIGGDIEITDNSNLTCLSSFPNLNFIWGTIVVSDNTSLTQCCVVNYWESLIFFNDNYSPPIIFNNSEGCNSQQEIGPDFDCECIPPQPPLNIDSIQCSIVATENLKACYQFDGNYEDDSGNDLDASSASFPAVSFGIDRFGNDNGALEFSGSFQSVSIPSEALNCSNCTQSFWLKSNGERGTILSAENSDSQFELLIGIGEQAELEVYIHATYLNVESRVIRTDDPVINNDQWHYISIVEELVDTSATVKIYVDGEEKTSSPESIEGDSTSQDIFDIPEGQLVLGNSQEMVPDEAKYFKQFNGSIDQLQFFDTALNPSQIGEAYEAFSDVSNCTNCTICNENISLTSQEEIDNFASDFGCAIIEDTLSISGITIVNLEGLADLLSVGTLIIDNTNISALSGLDNLENIVDLLSITNNSNLTDVSNIEETSINALALNNNESLEACCILARLDIAGAINISDNAEGCNSYQEITDNCSDVAFITVEDIRIYANNIILNEDNIYILSGNIEMSKANDDATNVVGIEADSIIVDTTIATIECDDCLVNAINVGMDNETHPLIVGSITILVENDSSRLVYFDDLVVGTSLVSLAGLNLSFNELEIKNDEVDYGITFDWPRYFVQEENNCEENDTMPLGLGDPILTSTFNLKYLVDSGFQAAGEVEILPCIDVNLLRQFKITKLKGEFDTAEDSFGGGLGFEFPRPKFGLDFCFGVRESRLKKFGGSIDFLAASGPFGGVPIPGTPVKIIKFGFETRIDEVMSNGTTNEELTVSGSVDIIPTVPPSIPGTHPPPLYKFTDAGFTYTRGRSFKIMSGLELLGNNVGNGSIEYIWPNRELDRGHELIFEAALDYFQIITGDANASIYDFEFNGSAEVSVQTPSDDDINDLSISGWQKRLLRNLVPNGFVIGRAGCTVGTRLKDDKYFFITGFVDVNFPEVCTFGKCASFPSFYALLDWDDGELDFNMGSNQFEVPHTAANEQGFLAKTGPSDFLKAADEDMAVRQFSIAGAQPYTIIEMTNPNDLPILELILPDGTIVNETNVADYYGIDLYNFDGNFTAFYIQSPLEGNYQVNCVNGTTDSLKIWGVNARPSIEVTDVIDNGDNTWTIRWFDSDPDDNASIEFRLDRDTEHADGIVIVSDISEDEANNEYTFSVADFHTGTFNLVAEIRDPLLQSEIAYYPQALNIVHQEAPNAPSNLNYSLTDTSIVLNWDTNNESEDIFYFVYYANEEGSINYSSDRLSFDNDNSLEITGLAPGHYYEFMVTAYDSLFRESSPSNIVSFDFTSQSLNNTPYILTQEFPQNIFVGETYTHQVEVEEVDGDELTFSLIDAPTGMNIDDNGNISWTPTEDNEAYNNFWVKVSDAQGAMDSVYVKTTLFYETEGAAKLYLNKSIYWDTQDDMARIVLNDLNCPGSDYQKDSTSILIYSTSNPTGIQVPIIETEPNSKSFAACFTFNGKVANLPSIELAVGDTIWAAYNDPNPEQEILQFAHYQNEPLINNNCPSIIIDSIQNSNCDETDGYISLQTTFGLDSINFAWEHDPNLNGPIAQNLSAGTYVVSISNNNGCTNTDTITLETIGLDECDICNGEGPNTWYEDLDGDGLGNPLVDTIACEQPIGFVNNSSDANDDCPSGQNCGNGLCENDTEAPSLALDLPFYFSNFFPTFDFGDTLYFYCDSIVILDESFVTATDNQDTEVDIQFIDYVVEETECTSYLHCGWIATDDCGNQSQEEIYIIVQKQGENPFKISCPNDTIIACDENYDPEFTGYATTIGCGQNDLNYDNNFNGINKFELCNQVTSISRLWTATNNCNIEESCEQTITLIPQDSVQANIELKVFLQGAMDENTLPFIQGKDHYDPIKSNTNILMRDDLRIEDFIPTSEPYTAHPNFNHFGNGGGESINADVLEVTGENAIMDWVLVEYRPSNNPKHIIATQAALLQRDGDVVDLDGQSNLNPMLPTGSYHIAIRQRNHLGTMTQADFNLKDNPNIQIDFTDSNTPTYGEHAQVDIGGRMALWGGNANADDLLVFQGADNDANKAFFDVLNAPQNEDEQMNYILEGYYESDIDINCQIIFQGSQNDLNMIFFNIVAHPQNTEALPNFLIFEQLPK